MASGVPLQTAPQLRDTMLRMAVVVAPDVVELLRAARFRQEVYRHLPVVDVDEVAAAPHADHQDRLFVARRHRPQTE